MSGVYVLQLNNEHCYYVGKSDNVSTRIEDHRHGRDKCAKFVSKNGGVKQILVPLTPKDDNLSNWEKDETLMRMIKHGFNNVRGWEFTNTSVLTNQECDMIKMSIFGLGDRCRKCGNSGHFAKDCSSKKASWLKNLEACYSVENKQKTSIDIINNILDDVEEEEPKKIEKAYSRVGCNRCGRTSHKEKDCYASVDVDGYELCDVSSEETDSEETDSEEEVWCCSYCNRVFDTENGARYHEMKYCKKKYRY
tara:strand:- start:1746 stop:2495 length:750 start_codon:yes stop_codon:yes gene_type:complete